MAARPPATTAVPYRTYTCLLSSGMGSIAKVDVRNDLGGVGGITFGIIYVAPGSYILNSSANVFAPGLPHPSAYFFSAYTTILTGFRAVYVAPNQIQLFSENLATAIPTPADSLFANTLLEIRFY